MKHAMIRYATLPCLLLGLTGCEVESNTAETTLAKDTTYISPIERVDLGVVYLNNDRQLNAEDYSAPVYQDHVFSADQLTAGMTVRVQELSKKSITLDPVLVGRAVPSEQGWTVNGILVSGLHDLQRDDTVMVFGTWHNNQVKARASLVYPAAQEEIQGKISQYDPVAQQFNINSQIIDLSQLPQLPEGLANGQWYEVIGDMNGIGHLTARSLVSPATMDNWHRKVSFFGQIAEYNAMNGQLTLESGLVLTVDASTPIDDGTRADLAPGRWLDVDFSTNYVSVTVDNIDFEPAPNTSNTYFEVTGKAEMINGSLSINGIDLSLTNAVYNDGLTPSTLNNRWVAIEGLTIDGIFEVSEISTAGDLNDKLDFSGQIDNGMLWGYGASDDSLDQVGYVNYECYLDSTAMLLSECTADSI